MLQVLMCLQHFFWEGMRKMVEVKAARNEDLVIGDRNSNIRDVPAKDYLRTMK